MHPDPDRRYETNGTADLANRIKKNQKRQQSLIQTRNRKKYDRENTFLSSSSLFFRFLYLYAGPANLAFLVRLSSFNESRAEGSWRNYNSYTPPRNQSELTPVHIPFLTSPIQALVTKPFAPLGVYKPKPNLETCLVQEEWETAVVGTNH